MRKTIQNQFLSIALLQLVISKNCLAQASDKDAKDERIDGRFLLDLGITSSNTAEGTADLFTPGFTWLLSRDLRAGMSTTHMQFDHKPGLGLEDSSTSRGLGDSMFFVQYDWGERLTASPWIPDDAGMNFTLLVPTGNAEKFFSNDTWGVGMSISWPIVTKSGWLLNPVVRYNYSFKGGPLAEEVNALDMGLGIVKIFPSKFWIGYTPILWYDFEEDQFNFDDHYTLGKMFSNGMGVGLDYGVVARESRLLSKYDNNLLLNFYYQFGK